MRHRTTGVSDRLPSDFKYRCSEKLEQFGDAAMDTEEHDEALTYYSAVLTIYPAKTTRGFSILQSKVCMAKRRWRDALRHADEVSTVVSSSSSY